jgi:hypothetical protein
VIAAISGIIQLIVVMVLPVIAGIWYAKRRCQPLTMPGCRHCGSALSFQSVIREEPCAGCGRSGQDLGEPVPLGRRSWRAAILPPALLMAAGIALTIGASFLRPSRTAGFRLQPTLATLYADALISRRSLFGESEDLLARESSGEDVVGEARIALIAAIGDGPMNDDPASQPPSIATASGSGPIDLASIALLGVPGSTAPPPEPRSDLAQRVLHACFRPFRIDGAAFRASRIIRVYSGGFEPVQAPLVRVLRVIACRVDGKLVDLIDPHGPQGSGTLLLAADHLLQLAPRDSAATEGTATSENAQRVEVECEEYLFRRFDAERLRDFSGRVIPSERWPQPLAQRRVTVTLDR